MITVYLISNYIIMFSTIIAMKTKSKVERLLMFLIAPVSLPIFIGFVLASLIDKIEDK